MTIISRGDSLSGAQFSECERYRYRLWRAWGTGPRVLFLMLNPSTADEAKLDPTVRRCYGYAQDWGYDGVEVCNIFAYRATDPKDMKAQADPIGPMNDPTLIAAAKSIDAEGGRIICAWGQHGKYRQRSKRVRALMYENTVPLHYLRMSENGEPSHPLYLPKSLEPVAWEYEP